MLVVNQDNSVPFLCLSCSCLFLYYILHLLPWPANRVQPNLLDLQMAFHELRVSLPQLLEYVQEVDAGQIPHSVPHIPVPKSQAHIYTGPGMRIQRKTAKATTVELVSHGADAMEVGSAGEEEEEEDAEVHGF